MKAKVRAEIDDLVGKIYIYVYLNDFSQIDNYDGNLLVKLVYIKKVNEVLKVIVKCNPSNIRLKIKVDVDQRKIVSGNTQSRLEGNMIEIGIPVLRESIKKRQYAFSSIFDKCFCYVLK